MRVVALVALLAVAPVFAADDDGATRRAEEAARRAEEAALRSEAAATRTEAAIERLERLFTDLERGREPRRRPAPATR
jgi:hypothetical protein